ncbi:hypothetical protein DIS24_g9607 [Lasiodiplodia hormozganensis]|uniref:Uncharacterized protein n=1 Tax=Lasiodiplodia hormozganensis TaxID=869390 RepID=A0AA40CIK7_9PEZI|nr:hypothetical protein DIS24_g9607 [Lasiodiplodia hormozganensis]
MIRRSNRLAAKRPPPPPGPDRLSVIPQELFLRICDYLVDDENDLVVKFGLTRFFGHIHPVSLAKGLRSLHCASKLLRDKTSTSICKLGFVMTVPGLKALLRMAGEPQIAPYVVHVRLLVPAQMWLYHKETRASYTQVVDMLTDCFLRTTNLRKVELSGIKSRVPQNHVVDMPDEYSWSVGLLLCALHASKACVTELIYDEGTEVMPPFSRHHLNPLPPAWLSGLHNIEKFRSVENDNLWKRHDRYAEQMLRAMPNLTEFTVTPAIPATGSLIRQKVDRYSYYEISAWMKGTLRCTFDWRLTAFHASHFEVKSANSLKHFLRTHSPTLRDLAISEVIVTDSNHHLFEMEVIARSFWAEIFQIILDDMNLTKGKFHDLLYWLPRGPGHHMSVAMYWEQNDSPLLDVFGHRFEEVAKVRGVTRALADWKDGMVMVVVH